MQAEGEPKHWSLFVAEEGGPGNVYQIKGDATWMTYTPVKDVNHMDSDSF